VALAACGAAAPPPPSVSLHLGAPADGARVLSATVLLSGTVSPAAATVEVLGRQIAVSGGAFSVPVPLQPGTNVIDVLAGAPQEQAAMSVVRVFRELEVSVPYVIGDSPTAAQSRLQGLHLGVRIVRNSFPLDFLIPVPYTVCATSPPAGRQVPPGSTIAVTVSKTC
jgi:hypothetical protein